MEKICRVCALAKKMEQECTYLCLKFNRIKQSEETNWDWGCRYFSLIMPKEKMDTYQYLLIKETEINTRK